VSVQDQPAPQPERVAVWELVIADYRKRSSDDHDPLDDVIVADMAERDRLGRERYGVPLTTHNGRDHLVDAYQEALDFVVYLRTWLEEHAQSQTTADRSHRYQVRTLYRDQLGNLWHLRRLIEERKK
jgi:hypothetical protein